MRMNSNWFSYQSMNLFTEAKSNVYFHRYEGNAEIVIDMNHINNAF